MDRDLLTALLAGGCVRSWSGRYGFAWTTTLFRRLLFRKVFFGLGWSTTLLASVRYIELEHILYARILLRRVPVGLAAAGLDAAFFAGAFLTGASLTVDVVARLARPAAAVVAISFPEIQFCISNGSLTSAIIIIARWRVFKMELLLSSHKLVYHRVHVPLVLVISAGGSSAAFAGAFAFVAPFFGGIVSVSVWLKCERCR